MYKERKVEIDDMDVYSGGNKDEGYSRSTTIMRLTLKVQDALCSEMKPSFMETTTDKFGNAKTTLTEDTRLKAFESITTLRNFLQCDFKEDEVKIFEAIDKEINEAEKKFKKEEYDDWMKHSLPNRRVMWNKGEGTIEGEFNRSKRFREKFIIEKLRLGRKILVKIMEHKKDNRFYQGVRYKG